jgi:circadian clock protein KaiB
MCEQNRLLIFGQSTNGNASKIASFKLYIKGMMPESVRALIATKAICEKCLPGKVSLEIIDAMREPHRVLVDGIYDIPTLVKVWPVPVIQISNELEDPEQILDAFGLRGLSCSAL